MGNWMSDWEDQEDEREEALRKAREEAEQRKAKEEEEKRQAEKLKQEEERKRREAQEEFVKDNFHWERPYDTKDKKGPEQLSFNMEDM